MLKLLHFVLHNKQKVKFYPPCEDESIQNLVDFQLHWSNCKENDKLFTFHCDFCFTQSKRVYIFDWIFYSYWLKKIEINDIHVLRGYIFLMYFHQFSSLLCLLRFSFVWSSEYDLWKVCEKKRHKRNKTKYNTMKNIFSGVTFLY